MDTKSYIIDSSYSIDDNEWQIINDFGNIDDILQIIGSIKNSSLNNDIIDCDIKYINNIDSLYSIILDLKNILNYKDHQVYILSTYLYKHELKIKELYSKINHKSHSNKYKYLLYDNIIKYIIYSIFSLISFHLSFYSLGLTNTTSLILNIFIKLKNLLY